LPGRGEDVLQERHTRCNIPTLREEARERLGGLHDDKLTDVKRPAR
jgi:hypothetical protein